jgi:hypothetical protein
VIRNAVIHIANEQPLLADLYEMPGPTDISLVCTNVRMLDGKKPLFIDHTSSTFVFPYLHIRFLEILAGTATGLPEQPMGGNGSVGPAETEEVEADLELDEDFLKRIRDV